jgi:hypothetical protein
LRAGDRFCAEPPLVFCFGICVDAGVSANFAVPGSFAQALALPSLLMIYSPQGCSALLLGQSVVVDIVTLLLGLAMVLVLALALVLVPMFTFLLVPILLLVVLLRLVLLHPSAVAASAATFGATSGSFVDSAEIGVFF